MTDAPVYSPKSSHLKPVHRGDVWKKDSKTALNRQQLSEIAADIRRQLQDVFRMEREEIEAVRESTQCNGKVFIAFRVNIIPCISKDVEKDIIGVAYRLFVIYRSGAFDAKDIIADRFQWKVENQCTATTVVHRAIFESSEKMLELVESIRQVTSHANRKGVTNDT